ncbi:hypothetical protein AALP_AA8G334800 [Arabis alpina]|uniref:Uncharacterized protein n=1 Tax=Arabis alpina TaxID=50452 RepID=A0A087GB52_ARAAL|nr:hypothetical protein AALP_AA8G334800 [Arabis alpina]
MALTIFSRPYFVPRITLISKSTNLSRPSLSPSRTVVVEALSGASSSYWTTVNADIQNHLQRTVKAKLPLSVYEPLRHFALMAPPDDDVAAALCVASYELVGGPNRDKAVEVAAALRLLYAVSYTHGALLEVDPSGGASGTLHEPYGASVRLLIGDGLLPFAIEMLVRPDKLITKDSSRVLRVVKEVTHAIGSQGMVEGQYRETLRRKSSDGDEGLRYGHVEEICEASEKMEGKAHACSAACGAILGSGNRDETDKLRSYGLNVGTIKGVLTRRRMEGKDNGAIMKKVEEMKDLAMKELESFEGDKVKVMYGLIDLYLGR